ncbi:MULTISPECIES: P-II family nitrogen regulator [unclassified Clostridium]|uniref:P-II family nitrogen regulator n=1 Tax=unclassified Clostridium TaxID=2614128 RepID=UPI0002985106|nr:MULTISPECIES: P-II family nitrogen regulator [unclassified Clostridium]EKQ58100.1 MAG: nitrogen regulatory protein PII [Clostridium sp. Maddingley MBC34-26]
MKKIEIIIKNENLDALKKIFAECDTYDFMISNIKNYNNQKAYNKIFRGNLYNVDLLRKVKVEAVVDAVVAQLIINKVLKEINDGIYEDGKIYISNIENVV